MENKKKLVEYLQKEFVGTDKWKYCKGFKNISRDVYRLFDIPDDVYIDFAFDIGSCLGEVAYVCNSLFEDATVVAVEASRETFEYLGENLKDTGIHICNVGIWEDDTSILENANKKSNIGENKTRITDEDSECSCKSTTIQSLFEMYDVGPDDNVFLKIDCEGCEQYIIDDLELCKSVYQLSIELHPWVPNKKELFKNFIFEMLKTHELIRGSLEKIEKRGEYVFRRKSTP